jgi:hypothetical protein
MIRGLGSGRPLTKFRARSMSGTNNQALKSSSSSKVLSALDARLAADFQPDDDGVIDLTTAENDALSGAVGAQLMPDRRPLGAGW